MTKINEQSLLFILNVCKLESARDLFID